MSFRRYCQLGFAAALLLASSAVRAADIDASPVLLVAKPELGDFYRNAVIFARPIGDGHIGFIVNRPTSLTMGQAFPGHAPSQKLSEPIFLGGPVRPDAVFAVVHRSENPGGRAIPLSEDMFLIVDAATVDRVIEQNASGARFFAGLVAWHPGELDSELQRGFWYVVDHDPRLVFRKSTDGLWEELVDRSRRAL